MTPEPARPTCGREYNSVSLQRRLVCCLEPGHPLPHVDEDGHWWQTYDVKTRELQP